MTNWQILRIVERENDTSGYEKVARLVVAVPRRCIGGRGRITVCTLIAQHVDRCCQRGGGGLHMWQVQHPDTSTRELPCNIQCALYFRLGPDHKGRKVRVSTQNQSSITPQMLHQGESIAAARLDHFAVTTS